MNKTINIIRHTARAATVLLLALLTAQTAGAWSGEGTESSPYKISNADDFTKFSNIVNGTNGETRNTSAWGTLTANIDMTGISCSPIGDNDNPYAGTFDGAGHTVEGIILNGNSRIGLFGVVANGGTVQGITLTNSNISGRNPVGGIAGMNWGTITNCHVTNTVSITGTYLSAAVGGIAGMNGYATGGHNGRVYGCTSAAGIQGTGNSSCVGGIVGNCNASTITDCIAIGAIVNSPQRKGAIVGNMVSSTLSNNYYNGCKVNSSDFTSSGVGIGSESNSSQKDAEGRVEPVFCIAAGNDVIMTSSGAATTDYGTNGIKVYSNYLYYNGAFYAKSSASVAMTLGHEECEGYIYSNTYSASDGTFSGSGSAYTLTMPDEDVIVSIARYDLHSFGYTDTYHPDGTTNPYVISDVDGWNLFCDCLNDNDTWNRFSGKTVRLGDDITVTRMAGGDSHEFTGTFDGGGKTLTVNYANTDNNTMTAPFSYVDGATIQNLIVGGTISGTAYRAAGIIGETVNTTSHITNCVSNVDISSGRYTGGFSIGGNVEIEGCVFNGKINGTDRSGGFIGYSYSAQVIKNSLFAPQDGSSISGGTFYYNGGGDVAPVNSYYTQALGTAQGKACHSVTAGENVTIDAIALTGTATQYTVSGITAYSGGGLQRGETLYYGSDDQLSLTLTTSAAPLGYQYAYTASAGTLSGTTLTMPDEDVTITAAIRNDGLEHEVNYMTADGTTDEASAIALDGTETSLAAGWYFVGKDISYTATLTLGGDVNLILADGKTMNVTTSGYARCIYAPDGQSLHIYGQTEGTGALNAQTLGDADAVIKFLDGTLAIHGGNVEATLGGTPFSANTIHIARETAGDALVIDRGTLTATANKGTGIYIDGGDARINGGEVTATGTSSGIDIRDHSTIPGILTLSGGTLTASGFYTFSAWDYAGTLAVASGLTYTNGTGLYDSTTETATLAALGGKTLQPCLVLADAADNTAAITDHAGKTLAVALSGRTLTKSGDWNTLCLPFDVTTFDGTPLEGATVKELNASASSLDAEGLLTLTFTDAASIEAGKPYIVKWETTGDDIVNPVFEGVTITRMAPVAVEFANNASTDPCQFVGQFSPYSIVESGATGDNEGNLNEIILMGSGSTLGYSKAVRTLKSMRAHFYVPASSSAGAKHAARAFVIDFGGDDITGIIEAEANSSLFTHHSSLSEWYTLEGRKLVGKPAQKGIYINNGKKVVIK